MEWLAEEFLQAHKSGSGLRLSRILTLPDRSSDEVKLRRFYDAFEERNLRQILLHLLKGQGQESLDIGRNRLSAWVDVYTLFWTFLGMVFDDIDDHGRQRNLYESWKDMTNALIRGYSCGFFEAWTLPCLYATGRWLRVLAIKADMEAQETGRDLANQDLISRDDITAIAVKNDVLEDAARVINRMFTLCITDRAPLLDSRKWALYYITNLLFKTYFKLNSISLCKNPWRALQASHVDLPPIEAFPKSHICTFKYYVGLMFFLEEDYVNAEMSLFEAYEMCQHSAQRNRELILTYLIPCRLLTKHQLPRGSLLVPYPRLQVLFNPICKAIKAGNLAKFDKALLSGEKDLVRARIYLPLERGRDICLRNLFRKTFLAGEFQKSKIDEQSARRTRIPIDEFVAATQISLGQGTSGVGIDEVECLLANVIFKGLMKGYIAREHGIVVLSKGNAFPATGV